MIPSDLDCSYSILQLIILVAQSCCQQAADQHKQQIFHLVLFSCKYLLAVYDKSTAITIAFFIYEMNSYSAYQWRKLILCLMQFFLFNSIYFAITFFLGEQIVFSKSFQHTPNLQKILRLFLKYSKQSFFKKKENLLKILLKTIPMINFRDVSKQMSRMLTSFPWTQFSHSFPKKVPISHARLVHTLK